MDHRAGFGTRHVAKDSSVKKSAPKIFTKQTRKRVPKIQIEAESDILCAPTIDAEVQRPSG
jgi:hypothetical protein